ncbi:ribonuclease domain-containing protein [Accumulibacter sp.]|uniref:ribonuclease domain-containing protein n=1 Tax=Accumulibacter sp. TaxID=2053492 RepID=UPI0025D2FE3A|nr:ribonuclease domain-containing protein [Accumulibacter sp.]MCM8594757.1 ribonuclease [Accumulibacter sp.]MCM8625826.1 ribonuclease [Accumulibacter sp.]MDS4048903.1 ribonuclease domain-containing protein [Accumulibacter sp.]
MSWQRLNAAIDRVRALVRLLLLATLVGVPGLVAPAQARESPSLPTVALADLPPEALRTLKLIRQGGPFPYPRKDGSVFGNFERHLPIRPRGYYREYTVETPGSPDRGARRIVAGEGRTGDVATSGEYYYSANHYRSFLRIRESP